MRKRSEIRNACESGNSNDFLETKTHKSSVHTIGQFTGVMLCLYFGILYVLVMYIDKQLPTGLKIKDEQHFPEKFIAERGQRDLKILTSLGPRIVGSPANDMAATVLIQLSQTIKKEANQIHDVEIDTQNVTGSYYFDYHPFGGYNGYGNVTNIIVKLKGVDDDKKGILLNAHYDSVPTSPGASDDGINCAVMLEVLRKLTQSPKQLKRNIYFLFNGAEETPLQASHGFITQHKWRKNISLLINLEAAGSGGKEILFQSGPGHSWLLDYYKKVPYPHGQVAGEEIFQSNLIPSDTDFRIFRDFGELIGYDFAFARNGYRYHTNYDSFESIPLGTYQHVGDNILHLLKNLVDAKELDDPPVTSKKAVYYDFLGLYMVCYDEITATILNVVVIICSTAIFLVNLKKFGIKFDKNITIFVSIIIGIILSGWILAILTTLLIGAVLDLLNKTMTWYSKPWLLIGLYIVPAVVFSATPMVILNMYKPSKFGVNIQSQLISHINRLIWTFILLIGTYLHLRSSYAIMIPVLFNMIFFAIILIVNRQYSVRLWRFMYVIVNSLPVMMIMYQGILVLSLFIPITGRIGNDKNPEFIVGLLATAVTILISSFFMHFVTLLKNPKLIFAPLIITFIILGIALSPLGFQYSEDQRVPAPQRYMIYHTNRVIYNETQNIAREDSGYFMITLDRNSPNILTPYIPAINEKKLDIGECKHLLLCGFPLPSPRVLAIIKEQVWIPATPPIHYENPMLELLERKWLSNTVIQFSFQVSGPSHINVYFSPKAAISLSKISLSVVIPKNVAKWNSRSVYFINYNWGSQKQDLNFSIQLETPEKWSKPALDIAISGKEFNQTLFSEDYKKFMNQFPSWANIVPAVSTFKSWIF